MAKILYLTTRLPVPSTDGRSISLKQRLEMMSFENEIYISTFNQNNKNILEQPNIIKDIQVLKYPGFIKKVFNVFFKSLIGYQPLQSTAIYSKKNQKRFNEFVKKIKPDIIICDMVRTSKYILKNKYNCPKILDMDDMLSLRYKRALNKSGNSLGQFKESLPGAFTKIINKLKLDKLINKMEYKRMKKAEIKLSNIFDDVILVSPLECDRFNEIMPKKNAINWPICVEKTYDIVPNYNPYQLCFLGNMDYEPNQDTLNYILKEVFYNLPKEFKLLVVGRCSDNTKSKFDKYERVIFTQEVDSVVPYVQQSLCLLAPIQFGTGIKLKILESMSFGVPVITSDIGAEGLSVENEMNIFISNSPQNIVKTILKLQNSKLRNTIAEKSIEYIKDNHMYCIGENIINNTLKKAVRGFKNE